MNRRIVFRTLGSILVLEAVLLLLPIAVSLIYADGEVLNFLITAAIALLCGLTLRILTRNGGAVIYAKEGFAIVAFAWIGMSVIGALPFVLSGAIPSYIDALFETVSGFTTTGASILTEVESLSRSILFWRSFTHWVGGMGVLVFIVAIIPNFTDRSIHILRAEMPGPVVGKLVPRVKETARILYLIYIALTVAEMIFLACGGMPVFDSITLSFGTAGTGGFGVLNDSIASYSPYCQWVITAFMILFGINFNLYFLLLIRRFKSVLKSTELWCYLGVIVTCVTVITINVSSIFPDFSEALRHSAFQVGSIITTTGYSTTDFNLWPELSKGILLLLMFMGASAGSTGGGFKVARVVLLLKMAKRELKRLLHPRSVSTVRFEGKSVDETTLHSVANYLVLYIICFIAVFLLLCLDPGNFDLETTFTSVTACFNNIGPGFGNVVGAAGNYSTLAISSKLALTVGMLLGRLEILPILLTFSPAVWKKQ